VENIGELQQLAVRAGINGVMMGNFLTTLGNTPAEDRAMFENLGLSVARQPDNAANPRPDNRSGWLAGETPGPGAEPAAAADAFAGLEVRLWDPSTQLRFARKRGPVPPRPDATPATATATATRD
jgi:biotin synthase